MVDAGGPEAGRRKSRGGRAQAADTRPTVSRRREVGHTSARSLLATILGEYVLPRDRPVWTSALVDVLAKFDVEERASRQALLRTAGEGWLASDRVGRRVRWALTPPGRRLLTEGAERIYGFGRDERPWDGTWLVILLSVPETKRELRHRLRTQLAWTGFGTPETGVWISPDVRHETEALSVLKELELATDATSFTANYGAVGSEEAMVARAWDLRGVEAHYEAFIDQFTGAQPLDGDGVLLAQTRLVHEWRRFPFLDPQLPRTLLPERWSGEQAADLFHRMHDEWHDRAQQRWDELMGAHDTA
ncbi:PaaX family transcriptional regulator C-terminal domain-containing protein [Streptomyces sp. NPDC059373]